MYKFILMVLLSFLNPANANNLDFSGARLPQNYHEGQFEKLEELVVQQIATSCPGKSLDLITRNDAFMSTDLFAASQFFSILNRSGKILFEVEVDWYIGQLNGISYGPSGLQSPSLYKFNVYSCL